jgi:hypothetical protein
LSALTDSTGKFALERLYQQVTIRSNQFYEPCGKFTNIKLTDDGLLKMGNIFLRPDTKNLAEINITAKKALIKDYCHPPPKAR